MLIKHYFLRGKIIKETEERPNEVTTVKIVNKIYDIVLNCGRMKIREIAKMVNISKERVFNILHQNLGIKKLSA